MRRGCLDAFGGVGQNVLLQSLADACSLEARWGGRPVAVLSADSGNYPVFRRFRSRGATTLRACSRGVAFPAMLAAGQCLLVTIREALEHKFLASANTWDQRCVAIIHRFRQKKRNLRGCCEANEFSACERRKEERVRL